ncbi:hypothetical protein TorRG33x02_241020 [Trema orientale]|uniref:Transmembrane protein n=1 Tax=Trema orientale TaxID=63057 RepID=A0A2P5DV18_TREOI|nr:hypothetical protein TorRG33x02_241020 [Trema orientale]
MCRTSSNTLFHLFYLLILIKPCYFLSRIKWIIGVLYFLLSIATGKYAWTPSSGISVSDKMSNDNETYWNNLRVVMSQRISLCLVNCLKRKRIKDKLNNLRNKRRK